MKQTRRIQLLGSELDVLTMQETLHEIERLILRKEPTQHVVINASKINLMAEDPLLRHIVSQSPLINADGQSVVWAGRFLGHDIPERVAGIDLFQKLVEKAAEKGWKPYYFGATDEVVRDVVKKHQQMYPQLQVAGFRNGYFESEESIQIAEGIRASEADILFVAFSSPKKEIWIHDHQSIMQVPFAMGVGGSFDVLAGKTKRAPRWMQRTGLEWFYRFVQEPRRMFKRYIIGNFIFVKHVWREKRKMKRSLEDA
ncbi:WecB/TagA/CpsF family glycosyltransferase [Listeria booriae]|uniref:WecB/TagA/CpsF family glycosyltransferase n=1 Tax=Listeria booriae TaxID=1552123 RepID=A0A842FUN6_9LIST|nr:WecB/TagA/CpsF family glycosyltransferase [Listeria booriae]MBC2285018.1 WecB/TagA/CpsF family glycosyltransferase [Listeria booriae]MBC2292780.1 WecB/TagA/CpsF family glycosyltransferase [Listeria booriae]MBC2676161.1 WecB/TagA/CpsF family glycosyltransferase [Listeria booriae]